MEIRFLCSVCGKTLAADSGDAGKAADCPSCGSEFKIPDSEPVAAGQLATAPGGASGFSTIPVEASVFEEPEASGLRPANIEGSLSCPVCWLRFDIGDIMHVAVHDSLRGDPLLGEDAQQRFLATRFNNAGQALDAMGIPCSELACPHCRRKLPPNFVEMRHCIISIVGDQSAGKSYYLSVLTKVLPATLFRDLGIIFQDSDPTGNAPVNDMRKSLFGAQIPAQAKLAKTVFEGAMYERLPRQGRTVALPRPFVYTISPAGGRGEAGTGDPSEPDSASSEGHGGSRHAVIFYDNAGEHFQPGVNIVEQPGAQHVAGAAGILFLFDPFNSPEFRAKLRDTKDPQLEKPVVDQQDIILAEMRARIQSIRNLAPGDSVNTPMAFVVGKADAWSHLLGERALLNPIQNGALNLEAFEDNSARVRKLVYELCPSVVANAEALTDNLMYFAVSSFGHSPVKVGPGEYAPDPARLNPMFVEMPLLWLFSQIFPDMVRCPERRELERSV
jgi:DNA-directed RNA polymerase subunit RPC12/RpoP